MGAPAAISQVLPSAFSFSHCVLPGGAGSVLHRYLIRSDLCSILASKHHSLLYTGSCTEKPLVAIHRSGFPRTRDSGADAGSAVPGGVWDELPGSDFERLRHPAVSQRTSVVRNATQRSHLRSHHRWGQPRDFSIGRRLCADRWRRANR